MPTIRMRIGLGIALGIASTLAWADWVEVFRAESSVSYIDPATVRRDGDIRRIWRLQDLKERGSRGERSLRALMEYDCKAERQRFISFSYHSGQMAKGKVLVIRNNEGEWEYVAPNTAAAKVLEFVCVE